MAPPRRHRGGFVELYSEAFTNSSKDDKPPLLRSSDDNFLAVPVKPLGEGPTKRLVRREIKNLGVFWVSEVLQRDESIVTLKAR